MGRHSEGAPPSWGLIRQAPTPSCCNGWRGGKAQSRVKEVLSWWDKKPEGSTLVLSLAEDTDAVGVPPGWGVKSFVSPLGCLT